jgi:hypothetical protein
MHDVEARRAMQTAYSAYGTQASTSGADIVDACSQKVPLAYSRLLPQGEHLNIVIERQPLYQGQECGDHAILSRSINAPRYYQSYTHFMANRLSPA